MATRPGWSDGAHCAVVGRATINCESSGDTTPVSFTTGVIFQNPPAVRTVTARRRCMSEPLRERLESASDVQRLQELNAFVREVHVLFETVAFDATPPLPLE